MAIFSFFAYSSSTKSISVTGGETETAPASSTLNGNLVTEQQTPPNLENRALSLPPLETHAEEPSNDVTVTQTRARRFSFRNLLPAKQDGPKPALSTIEEHKEKERVSEALIKTSKSRTSKSKSDKQAKKSALLVRSLIIGPTSSASPVVSAAIAKPQLSKIKSQLMQPKSANRVIAHLRVLSVTDNNSSAEGKHTTQKAAPIHAVCLEHTDAEEDRLHFAQLHMDEVGSQPDVQNFAISSVTSAPVDQLANLLNEMHVIDLIKAPNFGLGQPGDGEGLLAGAVPTAETVINGIKQITPELMALGYATEKVILPDHTGIYPPTDRISVLTYWWGLELCLPPASLKYLDDAQSITNALVNFLSALALVNDGIREILPFVRYIAQFVEFEFSSIKQQDNGRGVVCAATWIMPAAMVPRPWDFPIPPVGSSESEADDAATQPRGIVGTPQLPSNTMPSPSHQVSHSSPGSLLGMVIDDKAAPITSTVDGSSTVT